MQITPIATAHNGFIDKFGIPRQSRENSHIETRIIFEKPYRSEDAIRGIDGYSHLWLIWGFNKAKCNKLTVRPPRLGGNTRMGVFATRSPFRPNGLGLTSVRLLRIEKDPILGNVLVVSGADLLNDTPIYDIKPYLSFSDSHEDAINGFAEDAKDYHLTVVWDTPIAPSAQAELEEILCQDPRPAYQDDPSRTYKLDYANYHIEFRVEKEVLIVTQVNLL